MCAPDSADKQRLRLDVLLVEKGYFPTRARAQAAVKAGEVRIDGEVQYKPAKSVPFDSEIHIDARAPAYVSRAAHKLIEALDRFDVLVEGKNCLDLGTSTGGFAQVLLQRQAATVVGIEVGHGQLAQELAGDPRLILHEGLNARDLAKGYVSEEPQIITCDVSFISLEKVLPHAFALAAPGAILVALIKPQFEVGREAIGKGVVHSEEARQTVCRRISTWLELEHQVDVWGVIDSPILGGDGNREFLLVGRLP